MNFGASKGKSNNNQSFNGTDTTNFNQTSTPINPDWVNTTAQTLNAGLGGLTGQDPRQFIAPAQPLQTQAAGAAGGLTGSPWNFDGALDLTRGVAAAAAPHTSGVQALPFVQQYMDSGLDNFVNSTLADYDFNAGKTRAAGDLALAGSGAFGGSGSALTKAATEDALSRGRATTEAGLRSNAYTQALTAAGADAGRLQGAKDLNAQLQAQGQDRTLAAARQMGDLSTSYDSNKRADITTQEQLGEALRAIQQQYAQSPIDYQNALTQLFAGLPLNLFHGENQTGTQVENQSGTSSGSGTNTSFGFGLGKK